MADVRLDIVEGGGRKTIDKGWELRRTIIVYNVTGQGFAKVLTAADAPGMPVLGEAHPARTNCLLRELDPEIIDDTTIKFTALYTDIWYEPPSGGNSQPPSYGTIQVGASLIEHETGFDRNGDGIYVPYKGEKHPSVAQMMIAQPSIVITKLRDYSPMNDANAFVGCVNDENWEIDPAALKGSWLCTSITGSSSDNGLTYPTTYSFQRKWIRLREGLEGWDITVYERGENGLPPKDCLAANGQLTDGVKSWSIYPVADFNNLGLL
jgi:hypothetical protein